MFKPSRGHFLLVRTGAFFKCSLTEKLCLLHIVIYVCAARLVLRHFPFRMAVKIFWELGSIRTPFSRHKAQPEATLLRAQWALAAASGLIPGAKNCLVRALVLHTFLENHNIASTLRWGFARNKEGSVEGHAWLEHDDRVIIGAVDGLEAFGVIAAPLLRDACRTPH